MTPRLLAFIAFFFLVTQAVPGLAANFKIDTVQTLDGLSISLRWSDSATPPPKVATASDGRELLIHFSGPVEGTAFLELPTRATDWVANVETGYDSVLLRAALDVHFDITSRGDGVVITLRRASTTNAAINREKIVAEDAETERVRERQKLRAELLLARALLDGGSFSRARAILQEQLAKHPDFVEAHLTLAELETRAGRWPLAVHLYNRSLALVQDPSAAKAKSSLLYQNGQRIGTEFKYIKQQNSNIQREQITRGRLFAGSRDIVGFEHEIRNLWAKGGTDPTSGGAAYRHSYHNRVELYGSRVMENGQELTASLYGSENTIGVGLKTGVEILDGQTTMSLIYHQPYWEATDAVAADGVADRIKFQHKRDLAPRLVNMEFGAGYNMYSVDGTDGAAESVSFNGALRFTPLLNDAFVSFGYILDAEYATVTTQKLNSTGANFYKPINVGKREFHTLEFAYNRDWTDYLSTETALTYTYDRISEGKGPGATIAVIYRPITPWEFGLRSGWSLLSASSGGAGGKVTWGSGFATYHF